MPVQTNTPGSENQEAVLSWIQEFAPYGVVTLDASLRIQSWNRWMEHHSGTAFEEVAGKSLIEVYPELEERKMVSHFERALEGEASVLSTALHRYLLPLPSPFPQKARAQMLQTARIAPLFAHGKICGVVVVLEDVTQRESQAEALARQHHRDELLSWALAHLLETEEPRKAVRQLFFKIAEQLDFDTFLLYLRDTNSGRLSLETAGGVPVESETAFATYPFPSELNGGGPSGIIVLNSLKTLQAPAYATLAGIGVRAAVMLPLVAKSRHLGWLCFATCIRDTVEADESDLLTTIAQYLSTALDRENTNLELHRAQELLSDKAQLLETSVQERTARLQETISELETFSYTIAHDLRAPARSMIGYCEVLLEDFSETLPPGAGTAVHRIAQASKRMENLTHDLLQFSKVSRQEIALSPVDIEPIIEDLTSLRLPAVREAITICRPLHPVQGHRGLLEQVFSNLVDNAVKFVHPGKAPKITIRTEMVEQPHPDARSRALLFSSRVPASNAAAIHRPESGFKRIRIWVEDEGIGVAPDLQQKIFGIFERALTNYTYEGTGIGLAIVARAMQRMRGTCGVESEVGKGSNFWLELPAA